MRIMDLAGATWSVPLALADPIGINSSHGVRKGGAQRLPNGPVFRAQGHPLGNWRFNHPCLLTSEALALATWLDGWGKSTDPEIGFIEPNLSFAKIDSSLGSLLRISFELESRPPWAEKRFVGPSDTWIEFPLNESGAKAAAETLRDQLRKFPIRVGVKNN